MKSRCPLKQYSYFLGILLICVSSCAQNEGHWQIHQLNDAALKETGVYLDTPTISGATYHQGSASVLKASRYDRMLFIVEGACIATVNTQTISLKTADVLFLKANDAIAFSSKVKIMLWTSKSTDINHRSKTEKFTLEEIEKERNTSENVWNSFIETSTMVAGLYMLPKPLNGDSTLTHDFDEINYVVHGSAKFKMNNTVIDVKPGSVLWVKRGVGHYFYDLSDNFDVFILFETIHMNHDH